MTDKTLQHQTICNYLTLTLDPSNHPHIFLAMTTLEQHNHAEIPLIAQIERNEQHLAKEFIKDLDLDEDWVKAAIADRVSDIITSGGAGAYMAAIID